MYKPNELYRKLDEYIVGQDKAKKILSVISYFHYKRTLEGNKYDNVKKNNLLLIGPTGSGKTLMVETLAKFIDVPFVVIDATSLTESGYVGDDVDTIIQKLLMVADYNINSASKGIVFIDEIDKLAKKPSFSGTRDISGEGVQQALLKMIEGTKILVSPKGSKRSPNDDLIYVDTKNILFICGGSFSGIEYIAEDRLNCEYKSLGFCRDFVNVRRLVYVDDLDEVLIPDDFIKFGLIPEFIGRFSNWGVLQSLNLNSVLNIISNVKDSILSQYQTIFLLENIELEFTPNALLIIARQVMRSVTGVRSLKFIFDQILLDYMYNIPYFTGVSKIIFDEYVFIYDFYPIFIYND